MIRRALILVGRGTAGRDLGVTLGSRFVQLALAFAGNVAAARVLGPDDFGRFGLVIAAVMIAGTLADAGLTFGTIRYIARYSDSDHRRARAAAAAYFTLRAFTGALLCGAGVLVSMPVGRDLLGQPALAPYLAIGMLILPSLWISSYPGTVMSGLSMFSRLAVSGLLNAVVTVAGILLLAVTGSLNLGTLVAWNVVLPILSSLPAWLMLPGQWLPWRLGVKIREIRPAALRLAGFGRWTALSTLGAMLAGQVDLLLMGRLASPAATGSYSVAVTLAGRLDILNQSLFTVMMPRASRLTGHGERSAYTRKVAQASVLLAGVLAVFALVAQPVILVFYGQDYAESVPVFLILLPVILVDLVTTSVMLVTFATNQARFLAGAEWLRAATVAGGGGLLIGPLGGTGAALARLASRALVAVYTAWALRHRVLTAAQEHDRSLEDAAVAGPGTHGVA